jgi:hypothetical protein
MNILYFPNEIICEIYSLMSPLERSKIRSTCKKLYFMFRCEVPTEVLSQWKVKFMSLMGISMVEKLCVHQKLKFEAKYRPIHKDLGRNPKESITFHIDPLAPMYDNVRLSFIFHSMNPTMKEYRDMLESTNTFTTDDENDLVSTVFKFKDQNKNLLFENVDSLSQIILDMFFKFMSFPQYKNKDKMIRLQASVLAETILDNRDRATKKVFELFDNSNYVKVQPQSPHACEYCKSESRIHQCSRAYIYEHKVQQEINELRVDMKNYFYDGKDALSYLIKNL